MLTEIMPVKTSFVFGDVERELTVTRKVLEAVPAEHFDWMPHSKSMSLGRLAIHVAYLPEWARLTLEEEVFDFSMARRPPEKMENGEELVRYFDRNAERLRAAMRDFDMARWEGIWTMRRGERVMTSQPRGFVFRVWCINHLVHHRAQLCIYLRMLNVVVPTVYFNTADDPAWVFE